MPQPGVEQMPDRGLWVRVLGFRGLVMRKVINTTRSPEKESYMGLRLEPIRLFSTLEARRAVHRFQALGFAGS